jgi:acetyl-CoA carboxylase biotin carboxylase subunit
MRTLKKLLIANRGEIAIRVIRACRDAGIATVAVYSDADRTALHVQLADEAVHIGPSPARESYLDIDKILAAARRTGADSLHPGYGFLSENEDLAEACARAGVVFVGPPPDAIRRMGDKTTARATVTAAGVPVVPGDNGPASPDGLGRGFATADLALEAARRIGFPVMLKAAAGGGGKGMRLCESEAKFTALYDGARREAKAAFGDDAVYLEKAVIRPRHVEVQVFADESGHTVHMFERDCSIQRRHQKVVEESPSPAVTDTLREQMGDVAVQAAKAVGYVGAGTIEFLLDASGAFYFLEMNTRLQVEHPITEMVTGLDLVSLQLKVAAGEPLGHSQDELFARRHGAAIECRIYAEDPVRFLPSPGPIRYLRLPEGPYVRNDCGVQQGGEISVHYDPLVGKLITWGEDRAAALGRMQRALGEYRLRGIRTNLAFHKLLCAHPEYRAGRYDTGFIDREKALLTPPAPTDESMEMAAIAAAIANMDANAASAAAGTQGQTQGTSMAANPWREAVRWRR